MSREGQLFDKKSLRVVTGKTADWAELAKDCVCFATAQGGHISIGIEDDTAVPPADQHVDDELLDRLRRRIGELTVNVTVPPEIRRAENGGEFIDLHIPRAMGVPSTSDGRYFIRVSDACKPILGDDVLRLASERAALPWETQTSQKIPRERTEQSKLDAFTVGIRASDRVKTSVKEKTDDELLDHYFLASGQWLTNLGILCVGRRDDRARLGSAPVVQFIKYDELEQKVNKLVWDDYSLSPLGLVETVWRDVPDFHERYELPAGLFRQHVPVYDKTVIRELLVNALVHRPYTQRGDIFLKLYPDRLEVVNPGLLPLGVTPENVLHTTVRRNEHLARVFHDLNMMEREGTGFDMMYEVLLSQGRPAPELREGPDRVEVIVRRRILNARVIDFLAKADKAYQLTQRERICLGLLAQHEALTALELARQLELTDVAALLPWLGRLVELQLVQSVGRTKGKRYYVSPDLLQSLEFSADTTLKRIEPHRLEALILEDLRRYPGSSIGAIRDRIGSELAYKTVKRAIDKLVQAGEIISEGEKRGRKYWRAE